MSKENDKVLEASVGMAIVDALPVLCFSASMILIGQAYQSTIFMVGARGTVGADRGDDFGMDWPVLRRREKLRIQAEIANKELTNCLYFNSDK
ncbi:MAG: hypothetical protein LIO78_03110 [Clostridiales bacterium]|nr:hypothetical protein [Clostridiales bacterium]MCC8099040.1 hypothetical protein [Clostridiales bacterium]